MFVRKKINNKNSLNWYFGGMGGGSETDFSSSKRICFDCYKKKKLNYE